MQMEPALMAHELMKQLVVVKTRSYPYEGITSWQDENLWPMVMNKVYGNCSGRPSMDEVMLQLSDLLDRFKLDNNVRWLPACELRNNMLLVFKKIDGQLGPLSHDNLVIGGKAATKTSSKKRQKDNKNYAIGSSYNTNEVEWVESSTGHRLKVIQATSKRLKELFDNGHLTLDEQMDGAEYLNNADVRRSLWLLHDQDQQIEMIKNLHRLTPPRQLAGRD